VFLNAYGVRSINSTLNNFTSNNITNNTNTGLSLDSASNSTNITSNRVCYNTLVDLNNSGVQNNGTLDSCDSFRGWNENSHYGCTYACSSMWERIYGTVNGTIFLGNSSNTPYVYSWNTSRGLNVYFVNSSATMHWYSLQAIGRNTSNATSSNDFTELDTFFGTTSFGDNINRTYSTDGSTPIATDSFTVFGLTVNNVPIANSTATNTSFRTGIMWDTANGGTQYDNAHNQTTVWVVKVNTSASDVYGNYDYLAQIPYTIGNVTGSNSVVTIYAELK
jgi:hypothetical protein